MIVVDNLFYDPLAVPPEFWEGLPVVKNKSVFIKPNLVTPRTLYDSESTTRFEVVSLVVNKCLSEGAKSIIVGDCGFKHQWEITISSCGYNFCHDGVSFVGLQNQENYHKFKLVRLDKYMSLFGVKISEFLLDSEVVINIPKMKAHKMAGMTCCIKNLMGVITPKGSMHPRGSVPILQKRLRDLYFLMKDKIHFNVVDGIWGSTYSEVHGIPKYFGKLISGTDMFEIDEYVCSVLGVEKPLYLNYIRNGGKLTHR